MKAYRRALEHLGVCFDGNRDDGLAATRLGSIRPRDVAEYVRLALGDFSAKTVQLNLGVLHDLLKTARREELIDSNPAEGVERPKVERKRGGSSNRPRSNGWRRRSPTSGPG